MNVAKDKLSMHSLLLGPLPRWASLSGLLLALNWLTDKEKLIKTWSSGNETCKLKRNMQSSMQECNRSKKLFYAKRNKQFGKLTILWRLVLCRIHSWKCCSNATEQLKAENKYKFRVGTSFLLFLLLYLFYIISSFSTCLDKHHVQLLGFSLALLSWNLPFIG